MNKINAEELLGLFSPELLDEEKLKSVVGGYAYDMDCYNDCISRARQDKDGEVLQTCLMTCVK